MYGLESKQKSAKQQGCSFLLNKREREVVTANIINKT